MGIIHGAPQAVSLVPAGILGCTRIVFSGRERTPNK